MTFDLPRRNHTPLKDHLLSGDNNTYRAVTGTLSCNGSQSFDDHGIKYKVCGICSSTAEILTERVEVIDTRTGKSKAPKQT